MNLMKQTSTAPDTSCQHCRETKPLDFDFTMAFQPIVHYPSKQIFGYEALVRGLNNEPAYTIIQQLNEQNRYRFDQICRVKAISLAAKLKLQGMLSINFLPNAVYQPERCIRTTLEAAQKYQFPIQQIMFEFIETEQVTDNQHVKDIVAHYQQLGFKTTIDDFGAGYSNLGLLADFQTDIVKLDMALIRNIDKDAARQTILRHSLAMFRELNMTVLAEGIESREEMRFINDCGIELMQGYYFAKPGFQCLPEVDFTQL